MDLGSWPTDTDARVVAVDLEHSTRLRLSELGLRVGALVRVTHRAAFGGRVVAIGADRFAIDGRTCTRIALETPGGTRP
ncbi:MAG: ferrous iron transport protein A [Cellulomonas sp.]|uniref:FeoA family protein n=1 Tax=Cellulomonas sp. TaxID=40001 RepID=UPI00182FD5CE|nr:ferrous iron transport protein A [Cellulomonas sp.]NMM32357.1 ferrous iron transport protein A [Cellulomonas sp.]